jgi:hypothetical protein
MRWRGGEAFVQSLPEGDTLGHGRFMRHRTKTGDVLVRPCRSPSGFGPRCKRRAVWPKRANIWHGTRCYAPGATDCATKRETWAVARLTRNAPAHRCPPECPTLPDAAPYTRFFGVVPDGGERGRGAKAPAGVPRVRRCGWIATDFGTLPDIGRGKDLRRQSVLRRLGRRVVATLPPRGGLREAVRGSRRCLNDRARAGKLAQTEKSGPVSVRLRA